MRAIVDERRSPAADWSRRIAAFSAVLFLTSALSHRFGLVETVPFFWLLALSGLLAFTGLCLGVAGFAQIWERGLAGLGSACLGLLVSALVLAPYAVSAYRLAVYPSLNDVATDIARPPQFRVAGAHRAPPMNALGPLDERLADAYPDLGGRRYGHSRQAVLEAVHALLRERGWRLLGPPAEAAGGVTVEAVAHTLLLGFPADVAVRVEDRWNATNVDMRSASRYGRHDLGDNAARIERFLHDLDERMEEQGPL